MIVCSICHHLLIVTGMPANTTCSPATPVLVKAMRNCPKAHPPNLFEPICISGGRLLHAVLAACYWLFSGTIITMDKTVVRAIFVHPGWVMTSTTEH
jgi:hypothetical protein